jgi:hypothetical protein
MKPPPVGHHLAIQCYERGVYRDVLFADNVMICPSYTKIIYGAGDKLSEIYPVDVVFLDHTPAGTTVMYANETMFEITRIS